MHAWAYLELIAHLTLGRLPTLHSLLQVDVPRHHAATAELARDQRPRRGGALLAARRREQRAQRVGEGIVGEQDVVHGALDR
jgi:hypothetical protein